MKRLAAMLRLAPWRGPHAPRAPGVFAGEGPVRRGRVALLAGCVNDVLSPDINAAAIRVLTRLGIEVVVAQGAGCCGSLVHHMGREDEALAQARANIDAWTAIEGLDAIVITTSGCGTTVKDYGFMLRTDPAYAAPARRVAGLAKDIAEYLVTVPLPGGANRFAAGRGLSLGVLASARPARDAAAEGTAEQAWLRGERYSRRPFVLRFSRNLQYFAAGYRKEVARAQSRDYRGIAT